MFSAGEIRFKGFNGKIYCICYGREISFNCFEMCCWCLSTWPPEEEKKERKRIKTLVGAVVFSTHRWRSWCHFSTINKGSEQ